MLLRQLDYIELGSATIVIVLMLSVSSQSEVHEMTNADHVIGAAR